MSDDKISRTVLPIPDVARAGLITYDAKDPGTRFPPLRDLRPPAGSPDVLVILIDDVGFGTSSVFGGPCHTPNFEKLAKIAVIDVGDATRDQFRRRGPCRRSRHRDVAPITIGMIDAENETQNF